MPWCLGGDVINRRQKIVQQQFLNNEEAVIKRLTQVYTQSLKDVTAKSKKLYEEIEALTAVYDTVEDEAEKAVLKSRIQSKVYQKQYQDSLKKQVSDILDDMHEKSYTTVADYLNQCYEDGFVGALYDIQGQGIPLAFPLDQESMVRAVQLDSKISSGLYNHLREDIGKLKKNITAQVSRGISSGMTFKQIAQQLSTKMTGQYKNPGGSLYYATRIARTEGHRIQCQAGMDACYKAKEKGADVVKQWSSTLDAKTRNSHIDVDEQIRELDEKFSNGLMFPGDPSGGAAEVCNCRCALHQRARWNLDSGFTKMNNFTKQLETFDSPEDYAEFKKSFFSDENRKYMNHVQKMQEKYGTKDFRTVLDKMNTREYNHHSDLIAGNPLFNKDALTNNGKSSIMSSKTGSFRQIKGTHTIDDDIGTKQNPICNPNFSKGGDYTLNCGYSSATYEMRRRGFDVIANPKHTMLVSDWERMFDNCTPIRFASQDTETLVQELNQKLSEMGDGARGSIFVQWKNRVDGHIFSWEVENGNVRFVDGQNGATDAAYHFEWANPSKTVCLRWDDLEPTDMIKYACKNRGGD